MEVMVAASLSFMAVIACVLIHYEGLTLLDVLVRVERRFIRTPRPRIVLVMIGVMLLHVVEIWLFAGLYALLETWGMVGGLSVLEASVPVDNWFHYVYFSSIVYTTVGFGEIVPVGVFFRFLAASEALMGLVLVAWSASFTYLNMHLLWGRNG